jgi:hypothetical protein
VAMSRWHLVHCMQRTSPPHVRLAGWHGSTGSLPWLWQVRCCDAAEAGLAADWGQAGLLCVSSSSRYSTAAARVEV